MALAAASMALRLVAPMPADWAKKQEMEDCGEGGGTSWDAEAVGSVPVMDEASASNGVDKEEPSTGRSPWRRCSAGVRARAASRKCRSAGDGPEALGVFMVKKLTTSDTTRSAVPRHVKTKKE